MTGAGTLISSSMDIKMFYTQPEQLLTCYNISYIVLFALYGSVRA